MSKTNHVRLIGRLGANPQLKNLEGGKSVVSVSLATNDNYTNKQGEKIERADWHNLVAFGKLATLIGTYTAKGSYCMVLGKLRTRNYKDKEEIERYTTEIIVEEILFLDNKKE